MLAYSALYLLSTFAVYFLPQSTQRFAQRPLSINTKAVKFTALLYKRFPNQHTLVPPLGGGGVYQPSTHANISGATMVASLSTMNLGVCISSLPQVIFSFGTAPE